MRQGSPSPTRGQMLSPAAEGLRHRPAASQLPDQRRRWLEKWPGLPSSTLFPISTAAATHLPSQFKLSALLICPGSLSHHCLRNQRFQPLQAAQGGRLWPL